MLLVYVRGKKKKSAFDRIRIYSVMDGYLINIKIICFSIILKIITIKKHFPAAQLYIRYELEIILKCQYIFLCRPSTTI